MQSTRSACLPALPSADRVSPPPSPTPSPPDRRPSHRCRPALLSASPPRQPALCQPSRLSVSLKPKILKLHAHHLLVSANGFIADLQRQFKCHVGLLRCNHRIMNLNTRPVQQSRHCLR